ncbi:hypothetical protein DFH07DRAFT_764400 [Mycena maculata]|uniref:Uncharacterized protein n=1 Tax=Mycena maculata TaxID=230809 RepID=A0AAD7KB53_9AGAR|nr:hypothetical protein DFH07DRAFT_764400 [Mycena maculata]
MCGSDVQGDQLGLGPDNLPGCKFWQSCRQDHTSPEGIELPVSRPKQHIRKSVVPKHDPPHFGQRLKQSKYRVKMLVKSARLSELPRMITSVLPVLEFPSCI